VRTQAGAACSTRDRTDRCGTVIYKTADNTEIHRWAEVRPVRGIQVTNSRAAALWNSPSVTEDAVLDPSVWHSVCAQALGLGA